jgi:hypothetical protein
VADPDKRGTNHIIFKSLVAACLSERTHMFLYKQFLLIFSTAHTLKTYNSVWKASSWSGYVAKLYKYAVET